MIPESISLIERQLLINQCKILFNIGDEKEKDMYEKRIEILEKGYTGLYPKVFNNLYEEVPISVYEEISNIMKMYGRINDSIRLLPNPDKELLDLALLEFEGFDEDSGMHYYMMSYLVDRMDEHPEYKGRELKSHSNNALIKYNRMLSIFSDFEKSEKLQYSTVDLEKFINEVRSISIDTQL
ncbi:YfbU family protein [Dyadobacter sp. CY261]|uniref:YfbU family protein n=1 Tax=Dyadobacter sp. CY261 TaxID=2907203 RepID=UPI001F259781|nr:YfbU family protein [Dyadobacter sp. CY261]MCF0070907.1 YfbU family protein [Dyadobacter sp. CY261]